MRREDGHCAATDHIVRSRLRLQALRRMARLQQRPLHVVRKDVGNVKLRSRILNPIPGDTVDEVLDVVGRTGRSIDPARRVLAGHAGAQEMKKTADREAIADATNQIKDVSDQCKFTSCKITDMSPSAGRVTPYSNRMARDESAGSSPVFNPDYDYIYVRSAWNVTWDYVDAGEGFGAL